MTEVRRAKGLVRRFTSPQPAAFMLPRNVLPLDEDGAAPEVPDADATDATRSYAATTRTVHR